MADRPTKNVILLSDGTGNASSRARRTMLRRFLQVVDFTNSAK